MLNWDVKNKAERKNIDQVVEQFFQRGYLETENRQDAHRKLREFVKAGRRPEDGTFWDANPLPDENVSESEKPNDFNDAPVRDRRYVPTLRQSVRQSSASR